MNRQQTGRIGEELARRHLETLGFTILDANYRTRWGEIDLVAEKNEELVFVEVRTRRSNNMGTPEESITVTKRSHLVAAAEEYIQTSESTYTDWRIDLVAVELDRSGSVSRLDVIENAVEL